MTRITWFPEHPDRVLNSMGHLTLEEMGAEAVVRALIAANGDKLRDDDRFIAGHMRADIRTWRRIRKQLMSVGQLYSEDGFLRAKGFAKIIDDVLARLARASVAGYESGRARKRKCNARGSKTNELGPTRVYTDAPADVPTINTDSLSPLERETVSIRAAATLLINRIGLDAFNAKFGRCEFSESKGGVVLFIPTHFEMNLINSQYGPILHEIYPSGFKLSLRDPPPLGTSRPSV